MGSNDQRQQKADVHDDTNANRMAKTVQAAADQVAATAKVTAQNASEHVRDAARAAGIDAKRRLVDKLQADIDANTSNSSPVSTPESRDTEANGNTIGDTGRRTTNAEGSQRRKGPKRTLVAAAALIVVLVVVYGVLSPKIKSIITPDSVETSALLAQIVEVDDLSSAEFIYNGIAEMRRDGSDESEYHVAYDATVTAGISMGDIRFEVDTASSTVTPILPDIIISEPIIDMDSLDYLPNNPNADLAEIIGLCKADAKREAEQSGELRQIAEENMRTIVEALATPVLMAKGYSISWPND